MVYCVVINKSRPICPSNPVTFAPPTTHFLSEKCLDSAPNYPWTFLSMVVADTTVSTNHMRAGERLIFRHRISDISGSHIVLQTILTHFVSFLWPFSVTLILRKHLVTSQVARKYICRTGVGLARIVHFHTNISTYTYVDKYVRTNIRAYIYT
jgi:hypothetical protein